MAGDPRRYMQVYAKLSAQIADGTIPSGARINIGLLADQLETSRPTPCGCLRLRGIPGSTARGRRRPV
jgi:hypothetical protein